MKFILSSASRRKITTMLILKYAKAAGLNSCYRCQKPIDTIDNMTIDHIIPWNGDIDLYFALDNLSISHQVCNSFCHDPNPKSIDAAHHYLRTGERKCLKCGRTESDGATFKNENTCYRCQYQAYKDGQIKRGHFISNREDTAIRYEAPDGLMTAKEVSIYYNIPIGTFRRHVQDGWSIANAVIKQRHQSIPDKNLEGFTVEYLSQVTGRASSTIIAKLYDGKTATQILKLEKMKPRIYNRY